MPTKVTSLRLFTASANSSGSIVDNWLNDKLRLSMGQLAEVTLWSNLLTWTAVRPVLTRLNLLVLDITLANKSGPTPPSELSDKSISQIFRFSLSAVTYESSHLFSSQ